MDAELARTLRRSLEKQGVQIRTASQLIGHEIRRSGGRGARETVVLRVAPAAGQGTAGSEEELQAEVVLVAVGRRPYSEGLGLEELGVKREAHSGRLEVDEAFQTSVPGVYAIGDLIRGPMLAHKAEEEGIALAELLAGGHGEVNYSCIPAVVYTWPEVASVGRSEAQLKAEGVSYQKGSFPFRANGRALAMGSEEGLVKVLADSGNDAVLGVHIVGPWASDLIAEAVAVMEFGGSAEDIARSVHAHPSLSEALREAALDAAGRVIHLRPRKSGS
jgi:dihydrolipoamide dehydrogenase